ncbi:MAG: response regulator SirA [Chloroflexota bacterium]|nr:MAG: response regulator SirA [Chloroflexota bacterium]
MPKITKVIKRNGTTVDFTSERIANAIYRAAVAVGGRDRDTAIELTQKVIEILETSTPAGHTPTVEEIQDIVEKVLIENGHATVAKAYILYRAESARQREQHDTRYTRSVSRIPWAKMWYSLDWAVTHGVNTIEGLNERIARGEFPSLVQEAEAAYNIDIKNVVDQVAKRRDELKLVIVSGPSSSGKTTTTTKVAERLTDMGMNLVTLNVDNYFFDLEMHPKDEFGDYDFETPQALEIDLIDEHIRELIAGKKVAIPFYNFKTGNREQSRTTMQIGPKDVILIDSLHGLYPAMTASIPDDQKFKLYLEPLLQMKDKHGKYVRWTDLRLIRRMLRDAVHRAYDPRRTLTHWHYVRASEMRHILPNNFLADYIVNTGLPYELPIYAHRMLDNFTEWVEDYRDDPLREDAYIRAKRVHELLTQVTPVADDSPVPADSILREFIGGSCYEAA